jgi:hypothetical protein
MQVVRLGIMLFTGCQWSGFAAAALVGEGSV